MAVRLFEDKEHANSYWKYRISPSVELIDKVLQFHRSNKNSANDLAVDVGCGSGQGTLLLAPHFTRVVGIDISPAQLEMGRKHVNVSNISYRESPAEELPFEDGSVDLVTTMSAFHWFDHSRFLQEAHRVLKPHGCLAVLNYTMDMELSYGDCSETLNHICKEFYAALHPFRSPCLGSCPFELYKKTYDSLQYPVKKRQDIFWVRKPVPVSGYIGMVETFSTYQTLLKKDPEEARRLSQDTEQRLLRAMGVTSSETEVIVGIKYFYFLACKPAND
ncbi:putative methyltransferase DDB_G0268948 [Carassius gibelio]|uniref:putative methyltransferase DDB_G0268948 n=1 Tax=Carassius gibelio TaxID=101364 RepID=UPI00227837FC|nr:putative methyltransferase DDB_G0268948 [Carassius gibelio]XP_052422260.1 putative methyltransferase DDB_G0268948 [Carassius gibelio]XP_052422261.1 putative methyltransferase DDB_G0268948 [Carassius gibelio]XP_052422262.1 putative methyltransferase DDB_G0268948 [Carassius gibelio]XP_052422263.1 putative methyltransferase DDB_G0268948 [Carassius gibelio]XP_052422264.1 putative methyltransferase DDB_G0268948 [Carassius gibelio]XP_052422265.1 putative methyltransferase DDB_G0268948 [Carassius